jgi:threonylcarbamoyladenosine tRNA methylthiotransferase MtaB
LKARGNSFLFGVDRGDGAVVPSPFLICERDRMSPRSNLRLTCQEGETYNLTQPRYCPEGENLTAEEGWSDRGTIALQAVGCKLNQAETDSLARKFLAAGYRVVSPECAPDVYLLNTCTVTHVADRKCRKLLRQAHRNNPHGLVVATGCYAERAPEDLWGIEGVGLVVSNRDKDRLAELVSAGAAEYEGRGRSDERRGRAPRTRALVKTQEGCSVPCSYCIVPQVRGPERSRPRHEILSEINDMVGDGYKEVVLTGTRIGRYHDRGGLRDLIEAILQTSGLRRLRLSSLEPADLTPQLLDMWNDSRLCPHIHLPLQSGADSVLERMRRPYSTTDYLRAVSLARDAIPDLALTTDIMVGFPGETDGEFGESHAFCERVGFAAIHVFPYSRRPGTLAARMAGAVEEGEKTRRVGTMLELAKRGRRAFQGKFIGQTMRVLWEGKRDGLWFGFTENYLRVLTSSPERLANELLATRLVALGEGAIWGELAAQECETVSARGIG